LDALEHDDYICALDLVGVGGFSGAKIYDVQLLLCAVRSKAKRIFTFNVADFRKLADLGILPLV